MFLCIDTTSSVAGVTITGKNPVYIKIDPYHASEKIIRTIDEAIKKSGAELKDLEGVFVIKGPGSFTGLRVGIAVANQFAHQLKAPITGVTTDEWWSNRTDEKEFVYLQTMNKSEIYICDFRPMLSPSPFLSPSRLSAVAGKRGSSDNLDSRSPEATGNDKCGGGNDRLGFILPIERLSELGITKWLGELSDEHRQKLPSGFKEITDLLSPEETWTKIAQQTKDKRQRTYELVEPYYGKEPTITKSKKKLSI